MSVAAVVFPPSSILGMLKALKADDTDELKRLLNELVDLDVDAAVFGGKTLLHVACQVR